MATTLEIEAMSNFLLYTNFFVLLLMPPLITVQLFDDVLLFVLVITTLVLLVAIAMIANLMRFEFILVVAAPMRLQSNHAEPLESYVL
jgi:hypothetical protein